MTQLKKEFQKKDVERIRNLVQGKYGEKTRESIGYTPPAFNPKPNINKAYKLLVTKDFDFSSLVNNPTTLLIGPLKSFSNL